MIKTVIFDLDGTLLDSLPDICDAVHYALTSMNFPAVTRDHVRMSVGNGVSRLIERCLPAGEENAHDKCLKFFSEFYALHGNDKTVPYEGVERNLKKLKGAGIKIAVVSNKTEALVKMLCDKWFSGMIDLAIGDNGVRALKPDPAAIGYAIERLGAEKSDAVYVGDQEVDILSAGNAGVPLYAAGWGFRGEAALSKAGAKRIFPDFDSLTQAILGA